MNARFTIMRSAPWLQARYNDTLPTLEQMVQEKADEHAINFPHMHPKWVVEQATQRRNAHKIPT